MVDRASVLKSAALGPPGFTRVNQQLGLQDLRRFHVPHTLRISGSLSANRLALSRAYSIAQSRPVAHSSRSV